MSIETLTILLVLAMVATFATGMPVGLALGAIAMLFAAFTWGPQAFNVIPTTIVNDISSFLLLSIPLFIFMGQILVRSGLGEGMFQAAYLLAGRIRGGLAISVIGVCSMMGAMVGIIGAGIMTAGIVALPPMLKRGYDKHLALGVVMAGGGLGILIPPSIPMIVFSAVTSTSIGRLFAGALVPAAMMIAAFVIYIVVLCWFRPEKGPAIDFVPTKDDRVKATREGALAFALIVAVLGSIFGGIATPTEAAAIGATGACLIALFYRRFSWPVLKEASIQSMSLTGVILWILIGATVFSNFHMLMGAGRLIKEITSDLGLGPMGVIVTMQLTMLVLGCFLDELIIVLICAPLFTPIAVSLGLDPVWFGILMILNMEIAIQTPPYGFALFYLRAIAPSGVTMLDIYRSIGPFLVIKFLILIICMLWPQTVTYLPTLLFGQ